MSPANVLATIALEAPASLRAAATADGTVDLEWPPSASAESRDVAYAVLRRRLDESSFAEVARTPSQRFTDAPPAASYEYAVRTVISTFASANSPLAQVTVPP